MTQRNFPVLDPSHQLALRERPADRPVMRQEWQNLTFAHYAIDPQVLVHHLPPGLEPDVFPDESGEPKAWIGFIPFRIHQLRYPAVALGLSFLETNIRTYVHKDNLAGVWFFSLDAASRLAVRGARISYGLPYWEAMMKVAEDGDRRSYEGQRVSRPEANYQAEFLIGRELGPAVPGTLEFFLVERYLLFSRYLGRLYTSRVYHEPYQLRAASAISIQETLTSALGLAVAPYTHFIWSAGVEVDVFRLKRC